MEEEKVKGVLDWPTPKCYKLKLLGLDNRITLVLSNTRELNRDLFTN